MESLIQAFCSELAGHDVLKQTLRRGMAYTDTKTFKVSSHVYRLGLDL
jgi:hypothetical protein